MIGILFAGLAAIFWASGDFSGGIATRRSSAFQVLVWSALSGTVVLAIAAVLWHESFPATAGILWAALAGIAMSAGLVCFYTALSLGNSAVVAPISAVVGAFLPVGFTFITRGAPAPIQVIGIFIALAGIWLVSRSVSSQSKNSHKGLLLSFVAGISFGAFFILIAKVETGKVFTPLIIARIIMFIMALILVRINRQAIPALTHSPIALLAGAFDAGGNVLFLLAKQFTRLDIAIIISSLYPAGIVILAAVILKEKVSLWQKIGLVCCILAILLITV
jgi:drug/metabolite transporter (DMT)-like permease